MIANALLAAALAASTASGVTASKSPAAAIIEHDWVLANWALKRFDQDRDIFLSRGEIDAAAAAFREIADADEDGRVTPAEFRAAREFILARY
jgi:hypothetical protein